MARKKKQDNTSDNIQNTINDASISEKKTSQKRLTRSKVEDASSNKKPEIAELEDRLGLSIDYNEEENVITLSPNRPQQSVSSLRQRYLDDDAEFIVDGDEEPDYVFGAAVQLLPLINRCELYLIGREFTPTIVDKLWEPTDDDPSHTYRDMTDCSIGAFNSDPWNLFIYSKTGRQAVTFGELASGTFYLQCAAAEYVPNQDPTGDPIKQPMKDEYGRQMYRKVYFNGQIGQFPRITIGSYQVKDLQTGEVTTTQYDKYQYVADEEHFASNHIVWPQRKVTIYLLSLNFTVDANTLYQDDMVNMAVEINDNHSRNEQIIEIILPEQYTFYESSLIPILYMPIRLEVKKTPVDLRNAYLYAHDANVANWQYDLKCWGGELHFRVEPEDCGPDGGDYSDCSLYICAKRASTGGNDPSNGYFETIYISDYAGPDPEHKFVISGIDRNVNVYISSVRKNYTKKFIIMTDGNVIVSDLTELNDYLALYTDEQIKEMNTPDLIIVSYLNTIGFLSTSPEWPWNRKIRISAAIPSEYQGIRFKAIGRYNDDDLMYDEYVKYRQGIMSNFTWDTSTKEIDGITCTPSHNEEGDYKTDEPYIDYEISINHRALDETWERQIFYLAFEPILKFVSTTLKIFIGHDPAHLQVKSASGAIFDEHSDNFVVRNGNLWAFKYTTNQDDFGIDSRDPGQEGFKFEITNADISISQYSHVFISDNTTAIRDKIELPKPMTDTTTEIHTTYLSFTGRMYNNMSLFIRPLVAAKIRFYSNRITEFGPNDQHFFISYNGNDNVSLETEYQLTSEGDLEFSVKHEGDTGNYYTYIYADIVYGSYSWNDQQGLPSGGGASTHLIPNGNTLKFVVAGFASLMSPSIEYCDVTLYLEHINAFSVTINHPETGSDYWPSTTGLAASAVLRDNKLIINSHIVTAENTEIQPTYTTYTFSSIYGTSGSGIIDINNRHYCYRAVKPDGNVTALRGNSYEVSAVSFDINNVTTGTDYTLNIETFQAMHYDFIYECSGGGGHLTVVPYIFDYTTSWPLDMNDVSDMTPLSAWTFSSGDPTQDGAKRGADTPDLRMPLFGFRLKPTTDPTTHNIDIFSKMTLTLNVVDKNTGAVVSGGGPFTIASEHNFTEPDSFFGVCPGSLTNANARAWFRPEYNGLNIKYQFSVKMESQIAAEDLRITKVVYLDMNGVRQTISESTSTGPTAGVQNITTQIPGENPEAVGGNLEVYVHVPHALDSEHTLDIHFYDSAGVEMSAMYPSSSISAATHVSGDIYKFSITTTSTELYGAQSSPGLNYSGDTQCNIRINYNDNHYHWLDPENCSFYTFPVFKLWFNSGTGPSERFSFDDAGNATIYFAPHIAGSGTTTRTPDPTNHPTDPVMNVPTIPAGTTYTQSQWNATGCLLQISDASGLSFYCDGQTHAIASGGHFYKLDISGGIGFNAEAKFTMNVFNKTKTAKLRNVVTFSNIKWWNGTSLSNASSMADAYLSPVTRFDTSGVPTTVLSMTATVDSTAAASMDLDSADLTCGLSAGNIITCQCVHPSSGTNQLALTVKVDSTYPSHREYGAQKIDEWNLSKRNDEHPELSDYASMLYTGRPIPFTLTIDDFSYTFYIKMGAVLFIWVDNTTGGEMEPHTGQEHVVRARAREWYSLDNGVTVSGTGNYYGTGEDTSYTAREYYAKFEYYNGSTYSEIPNATPSASNIKSERNGNGFNIVAPTCWQDSTGKWYNGTEDHTTPTGPGDWGAWRMTITDESHANESGKMRVTMQVFDHQTPEHSVLNWYPVNATSFEMNVRDFMTVSGIHWWIGTADDTHGSMKFETSVLPPVMRDEDMTLWVFLAFADTSKLNLLSTTVTTAYDSEISTSKFIPEDDATITTHTPEGTFTKPYHLLIMAKVTVDLDDWNLHHTPEFYTGKPIKYTLTIPGLNGGSGFLTNFDIPLGPVIALHNSTPNSTVPSHNDGAILKPVAGNQCVSQTRGHEWYKDDSGIHMTGNGYVAGEIVQNHKWEVTWKFNTTNLNASSSPDTGYNRQFAYPGPSNPCIKIQHPIDHWTDTSGRTYPASGSGGDGGAWLISILNATDPNTSQELNGSLVGTVTVTDENNSIPVYKRVHNWYPAKDTVYGIYTVGIQKVVLCTNIGSPMGNPSLSDSLTIWQASDGGNIKLPASLNGFKLVIFANIPQYMNDEVNSSTWASKVHILPGNNNLYSYRLTGTNSRFYLDVWPWYTKKLSAAGRSTHNATHYVAVTVGSIYDSGSFGRTDADGYWISKNSNTANPYQIKIVTSDTEIQPDDQSGTVYAFNYTLDDVIDLKAGSNASDGYKVLGVHINESTTIRVWHTLITNATKRETNPVPNYTVPDEQITPSNISFTNGSGSAITMPSTVDVQVSAYQQDSETHLYYVDVTLRNTANMANYEDLPSTMHMKVTIGRRSVTRVFYLAYANLDEALLREDNGAGDYEYNYFWNREFGEPLGLPCAYKSAMDIKLLFNGFPGGPAGDGHLITEIKFDYPGTTGDELGNLFDGLFTSSNDQWVGPTLTVGEHIFTGLTTRNGYHLGSYEEYNIIIKTADGHKYIQKFSFPTMCIFNGIWIEPSCAWESGGVTYGLFIPEHDNQFTFQFRHQYKQWSTTQETFIHPLTSDRLTASNVKFYLCNSDETVISETNDIQVNSMGYQGTDTTYSPSFNVYCTIKLVNPPSNEALYKVVITNNTCPSGTPYLYEDEYLSVSTDTGILRVRQLSFFCFGGGE